MCELLYRFSVFVVAKTGEDEGQACLLVPCLCQIDAFSAIQIVLEGCITDEDSAV